MIYKDPGGCKVCTPQEFVEQGVHMNSLKPTRKLLLLPVGTVWWFILSLAGWPEVMCVVNVDLGSHIGPPSYRASGFIYGLSEDGTQPPERFLTEINVRFLRAGGAQLGKGGWVVSEDEYKRRWNSVHAYYSVAKKIGATFILLVHDLWGADGISEVPRYPGDDGDWSEFDIFLTRVIDNAIGCGMTGPDVQWDIWNEPDIETFWPRDQEQYLEMWKRAYKAIRQRLPGAVIIGPSTASPPALNTAWFGEYFAYIRAHQVVPDYISWHELNPTSDPVASAQYLSDTLSDLNITIGGYQINEYGPRGLQGPGISAWYIARLERAKADGARANWGMGGHLYDTMGGLVVNVRGQYLPLSAWWVYKRYADMSGELVSVEVEGTSEIDGVAATDPLFRQAIILLGSHGVGGSIEVNIENVPPYLVHDDRVHVVVERIPGSWVVERPLEEPLVIFDDPLMVSDKALRISISWLSIRHAYVITLRQPE